MKPFDLMTFIPVYERPMPEAGKLSASAFTFTPTSGSLSMKTVLSLINLIQRRRKKHTLWQKALELI
jgi:hypothetical protein